jgi:uncharacterized repeat protein (TIGR01451 family)
LALIGWAVLMMGSAARPAHAQDLPTPAPNLQVIPAGSLVIPMDNAKQNEGAQFNLRAYGLVSNLLHADIPVKWVIRTGKAKDGTDFTATAARIAPTALAASRLDFAGGPMVVHAAYAAQAKARISSWNAAAPTRRVHVYELTEAVTVDVRHDLLFKPRPFVNSANSAIATDVLNLAGITNYVVGGNADILSNGCYTILIEPHNTNTAAIGQVRSFLEGGGNFYAQCASVMAFENQQASGRFLTVGGTAGLTAANTGNVDSYPNPDLAFSQFIGAVTHSPGGSEEDWRLSSGSLFRSHAHAHARANGSYTAATQPYAALAGKIRDGLGGMVFYMGGHDNRGTSLGDINLQRMLLNAVLTPAARPTSCNIVVAVPDLTIEKGHTGSFYADSVPRYTLSVRNVGSAGTVSLVTVTDTLPAGLTYEGASGAGWTFTVTGQVVRAEYSGSIPVGGEAAFRISVMVGADAIGTVTNRAHVAGGGEVNITNNTAVHRVTAFGHPRLTLTKTAQGDNITAGGFITYSMVFTNVGNAAAVDVIVTDSIPEEVAMVVGSADASLPPGIAVALEYSTDGLSWTHAPTGGGCGAASDVDACVARIRWRLLSPLPDAEPGNVGTVWFIARIR